MAPAVGRERRLNWGCGAHPAPGWLNSDRRDEPGIDISVDIRDGLPLPDESFDYIVSIHALPEIAYPDLVPVLTELRRVLKTGGTLRLALPDIDRGINAYLRGDLGYFLIPDEHSRSAGGKLITQLLWYGYNVSLFSADFVEELLGNAGFRSIEHCKYRETASGHAGIVELDNRERESLFIEATK